VWDVIGNVWEFTRDWVRWYELEPALLIFGKSYATANQHSSVEEILRPIRYGNIKGNSFGFRLVRYVKGKDNSLAYKFKVLLKLFTIDLNATQIQKILGINRVTVNRYLKGIRKKIALVCEHESPFNGTIELDESYFGQRRKLGKRGRGSEKTKVFGILKGNGKVFTEIVPDCAARTLQKIVRGKVDIESVLYTDGWRGYNGIVDLGYKKHLRINHSKSYVRKSKGATVHINGIEGFWGLCKSRLLKFKGISKSTFYLHLKEAEFRFNNRNKNIYEILVKLCRSNPLF